MIPVSLRAEALRQYRLFQSSDLDDTREQISRVMQPHALEPLGRGRGESHMDFVQLGGTGLGIIGFGDPMHVKVEAVDGYHLLMFCVAGSAEVEVDRETLIADSSHGVLCTPGQSFHARLSEGCEQFILRIQSRDFAGHMNTQGSTTGFDISSGRWVPWLQHLHWITSSPELLVAVRQNPRVATGVEYLLLELLAAARAPIVSAKRTPAIAPGIVGKAIDVMHARYGEPLRVQDLADAVAIPERTLRDAFQRFKGMSPMQYLHDVRLERAYEALCRIDDTRSVSDIALDCGFTHLGRFSIVYREKFGESPSDTLRRVRQLRG